MHRLLATCLLLGCASVMGADAPSRLRPISRAQSVLAVSRVDNRLQSDGTPYLILSIWPDGKVVWSEDRVMGGGPYREGHIPPARVAGLLERFQQEGLLNDPKLAEEHVGPDTQFTSIILKQGSRQLRMRSQHELAESNGKWVETHNGTTLLHARSRAEVLRTEPSDYLYYRLVWSEVRSALSDALPANGTPSSGKPYMRAGILSWQETSSVSTARPVYTPHGGYVPDAETAIKIAEAAWTPIYGQEKIRSERPFHANLSQGVWTVTGTLSQGKAGGVALAEISRKDGRILRVIHGK